MRVGIVYNVAKVAVVGRGADLASDFEMELIPNLVAEELSKRGYSIRLVEADWNLAGACRNASIDIVLNLAEGFAGTNGHEHLVPCLLDFDHIPYTGADAMNMMVLRDKAVTKEVLSIRGVKTPRHSVFLSPVERQDQIPAFPLILKPLMEEASIGIRFSSVVRDEDQFSKRLGELLAEYNQPVLAEEFIVGRELSVGIWGNDAVESLPICEFTFEHPDPLHRFRSFEYKWLGQPEAMQRVEGLSRDTEGEVRRAAVLAHQIFRCRDYSRADFRLSLTGELYFLEHNFNPGIGPNTHGLSNTFTKMAEFASVPFGDMLERIINLAAHRYQH